MKVLDTIRTANRNLLRSKLRTSLTISAIFIGAFTLTLTNALGDGAQDYLDRQLGNVSAPGVFYVVPKLNDNLFASNAQPKEYDSAKKEGNSFQTPSMTKDDLTTLKKVAGVDEVRPYRTVATEYIRKGDQQKKLSLSAINPYTSLNLDLAAGRLLKAEDKNAVILPENYLKPLGFDKPADAVDASIYLGYRSTIGKVEEYKATVVGVMKKSLVTEGEFHVDDFMLQKIAQQQGGGQSADQFTAAIVTFKDTSTEKENEQKQRLGSAGSYTVLSLKEQVATINNVVSAITTGLSMVGLIALFAASFGIINTLLMSVYERTKEVGLMKALGMHRSSVFFLFAVEAMLVGFWGSIVAVAAAYGTSHLVNNWAATSFLKDFESFTLLIITPANALSVIGLIMAIAFLAGTLPAVKASRLNPIDALRSE